MTREELLDLYEQLANQSKKLFNMGYTDKEVIKQMNLRGLEVCPNARIVIELEYLLHTGQLYAPKEIP